VLILLYQRLGGWLVVLVDDEDDCWSLGILSLVEAPLRGIRGNFLRLTMPGLRMVIPSDTLPLFSSAVTTEGGSCAPN
jgi:hypothetical protein